MSSLADCEKQALLDIARRALIHAVEHRNLLEPRSSHENLQRPAGAFVTFHRRGRLRGCIGQLAGEDPLHQVVAHCAKAAALEDPRFEPILPAELAEIDIQLSILSPLEEIAPERIEISKHGLIISRGRQRGVLLPQVAAELRWTPERFLEEACAKAGMDREAWKDPATRVQVFTAEVFSEMSCGR